MQQDAGRDPDRAVEGDRLGYMEGGMEEDPPRWLLEISSLLPEKVEGGAVEVMKWKP